MPDHAESEFDQLVGPAEDEFDKLVGAGSDQQQILDASTNPAFRIGHGQEMPVQKIEGGPYGDAYGETSARGLDAPRKRSAFEEALHIPDPERDGGVLARAAHDPAVDAARQHMVSMSEGPGQLAKDFAASTAATAAGGPTSLPGQMAMGAIQGATSRLADDPNATIGDVGASTALGSALPGLFGLAGKAGSKLINAGNKGLARIALGPAELARLRAIGGEPKLADLGQRMRDAGLDKGGVLPVTAQKISDNALGAIETQGPAVKKLENELLNTNGFGQSEIDTSPLTSELRSATRMNSAETSTPQTAAAMETQAKRFESVPETVQVQGEIQQPPALGLPTAGPAAPPPAWPGMLLDKPAPPPAPPVPPPVQTELPLPEPQYNHHVTPPGNAPAIAELGLRPEEGGKNFAFAKNKNSVYMSRPEDVPMWTDKVEGLTGQTPMELRTTAPAVTPPGANPAVRVRDEAIAPERIQYKNPEGAWSPVSELAPEPPMPPAGPPVGQGRLNFEPGGTPKPLEAVGELTDPYTVERAILDKRDIGKRLFDKKQRVLDENVGADEGREISWRWLKDRFQKALDDAAGKGVLEPGKVADYRTASKDFHTAAEVAPDAARKAEQELKQAANKGTIERAFSVGKNAGPGTQYNLGRLLGKAEGKAPAAVAGLPLGPNQGFDRASERGLGGGAMSPEQRSKAEQEANGEMKKNLFKSWYAKLAGETQ